MDKEIKLAWLAGIIEGEGCFSLNSAGQGRNYFIYCISITNTDFSLLQTCADIIKENGIFTRVTTRGKIYPNRKQRYDMKIEGIGNMIRMIEVLMPYLFGQKKAQAQLLLNFLIRRNMILNENKDKSPRRRKYDAIDYSYLKAMKELKSISESVETKRSLSHVDKVIVRADRQLSEIGRNDLSFSIS